MHKRYLAELAAQGLPVVPLALVAPRRGTRRAGRARGRPSARRSSSSPRSPAARSGTIRTRASSSQARRSISPSCCAERDALVQPYLPTIEDGEVSLVCLGGELSHAVLRRPAAGDFRVQHEHGGSVAPHRPTPAERALAQAVLGAVGADHLRADRRRRRRAQGPLLMEAELIEPELYLPVEPAAAARFAACWSAGSRRRAEPRPLRRGVRRSRSDER